MSRPGYRSVEAFRYRLPLVESLVMPSGTYHEREGLLIRLTEADGIVGWGDAAPLPGYSPETLDEAIVFLTKWARGEPTALTISGRERPSDEVLMAAVEKAGIPKHSAAAAWAIVQADAEIEAQRTGRTLAQVYASRGQRGTPADTVGLNALLIGDEDAVLAGAARAVADGYGAAKLKVGALAPGAAANLVRRAAAVLGDVSLRADANGAWSLDEAFAFADAIGDVEVEYVEEPLDDVADLPELARRTRIRWALDESLDRAQADPDIDVAVRAAVVKPTLGAGRIWWASRRLNGTWTPTWTPDRAGPVVISSTFESGAGMRHLVAVAAAVGTAPAGLDTYRWLADDVLERRLPIAGPTVDVAAVLAPNPVRMDRLERIDL